MFASKIGAKFMNHKVLNIYKSRLGVAWIVAFLSAITDALLAI
jgi:hypothetical protein